MATFSRIVPFDQDGLHEGRFSHDVEVASARLVAETAPVGLVALTGDARPVFANRALADILGYDDTEELLAAPLRGFHAQPEVALDILRERLDEGVLDGVEIELLRRDGSPVQVRINGRVLSVADREMLLVASVEDITRQQEEDEESAHSQKMEAVARFAAGVAHDYNNLLTSILGEAHQLLVDLDPDDEAARSAQAIVEAARSASRLTQRLLVFAKAEVVSTRVLDLAGTLRSMGRALEGILPEDVDLVWRAEGDAGHVRIAPRHLEHIVANLVTNARDAMPAGGRVVVETGRVSAPADTDGMDYYPPVPPGEYSFVAIGDAGIGMNRETRRRIFDPFFTTKSIGDGAGLGLTTVYGMVQRARGHISVMSAPAYGTVARVLFPLCEPEAKDVPAAAPPRTERGHQQATILVVDDDEPVRRVMARYLRKAGFQVLEASDGLVAQQVMRRHRGVIDLLVTDVMMPRMKGTELAGWAAAHRPDTRILLVSGYMDSHRIQAWVDEDDEVFLAKPFEPDELLERVRQRLGYD